MLPKDKASKAFESAELNISFDGVGTYKGATGNTNPSSAGKSSSVYPMDANIGEQTGEQAGERQVLKASPRYTLSWPSTGILLSVLFS